MNGPILQSVDVTNFRSIRGHVHAPLDARVVLVHGENGAGKTSLLAEIELALTGAVASLRRADPGYAVRPRRMWNVRRTVEPAERHLLELR